MKEKRLRKYDDAYNFQNGFARVKLNKKYGFINEKFEEFEIKYDDAWDFKDGFAIVKLDNKWGFVNEKFEEFNIKYDDAYNFQNGFAIVKLDNKWGFINEKFEEFEIKKIYGYKGTDKNMICTPPNNKSFQYEIGKKYEVEGIKLCEAGFHFCYNLENVFGFYKKENGNRFFKVEVELDKLDGDFNEKLVSNNIKLIEEITDVVYSNDFDVEKYRGSFEKIK
jgi:hypothetical protein